LFGHQLVDEGERLLRGGVAAAGRAAYVVAVRAADAVPMVAVGDQHVVAGQHLLDGGDSLRIAHPLDDVLDRSS
jgi:hypothetical protein